MIPVGGAGALELGGCLHPMLWQEESCSHLWHKERVRDGVLMDSAIIVLPLSCWTSETLDPVNPIIVLWVGHWTLIKSSIWCEIHAEHQLSIPMSLGSVSKGPSGGLGTP